MQHLPPAAELVEGLRGRRLVIVSNREPYEHRRTPRGVSVERPTGGLVAALDPVLTEAGGAWVAWGSGDADFDVTDSAGCVRLPPDNPRYTLRRVRLTRNEVERFYHGYANQALWPLCHLAVDKARFVRRYWEAYQVVNRRFAEATLDMIEGDTVVWLHDYQLTRCARFLRERRPDVFVMQFWHIPWPAWDVFRICPQRAELIDGLLANDLIGFHLPRHVENFLECAERELGVDVDRRESTIVYQGRVTRVEAFPISIDVPAWDRVARSPACTRWMNTLRTRLRLAGRMIGVGVDRLDYTKGLLERLRALDALFHRDPSWRGRFVFIQKASPSRTRIKAYRELEDQVEAEIARINAAYGTADWIPIVYLPRPIPPAGMAALYRMADVCLVTSLQDGMNLVAKEFIASQVDARGVLVLSELAGAAEEAPMSVMVNPFDQDGMVDALRAALMMASPERERRMAHMRAHLARHDVRAWMAQHFRAAARLLDAREATRPLPASVDGLLAPLQGRDRLAVLLDFDGTLAPIADRPQEAHLTPRGREALARLQQDPRCLVGVVSGRALEDVRARVNLPGLYYVGNYGLEIAGPNLALVHEATAASRDLIAECARRLRNRLGEIGGAFVEDKGLSISVHYRMARRDQIARIQRIVLEDVGRLPPGRVVTRRGRMAIDIQPDIDWDKGRAVDWLLSKTVGSDWRLRCAVVYAGDDYSDEDAFATLSGCGITIRVGPHQMTAAGYRVADETELARFLEALAAWVESRTDVGLSPPAQSLEGARAAR